MRELAREFAMSFRPRAGEESMAAETALPEPPGREAVPQRVVLFLADIGGYTRFLGESAFDLLHAQTIVDRLMSAVVAHAAGPLRLVRIEGDAGFFYALPDSPQARQRVIRAAAELHRAFVHEQIRIRGVNPCHCAACEDVLALRLKFVAHAGEVALVSRRGQIDLARLPVILAHRLLKNDLPLAEYLLMTREFAAGMEAATGGASARIQSVEGFGEVELAVIEYDRSPLLAAPPKNRLGAFAPASFRCTLVAGTLAHAARGDRARYRNLPSAS